MLLMAERYQLARRALGQLDDVSRSKLTHMVQRRSEATRSYPPTLLPSYPPPLSLPLSAARFIGGTRIGFLRLAVFAVLGCCVMLRGIRDDVSDSGAGVRAPAALVVLLTYGPSTDWVRNVLAALAQIERCGMSAQITEAQVASRSAVWSILPLPARLLSARHFLHLHVSDAAPPMWRMPTR